MGRTGVGTLYLWLCAVVCLAQGQDLVNVAPNKSYSQSSTYSPQKSNSMAADGDTLSGPGHDFPDNCIHTLQNPSPSWFEVDLGRTYPVYNITLWARYNLEIRLNSSIITVDNQTCASIKSFPTREKTVTCPSVMYGQKVRITRQPFQGLVGDDRTLNLCEIQIWVPREVSECEAGRYGTSCDMHCNNHCGKGPGKNFCYQSSGYCYDDCVSGWYGDQCSTPCSPGCQNTACDRQPGHCYPCKTGYKGAMCQECEDTHYKNSSEMCVQCSANCQSQSCEDPTGKCKGCAAGHYGDTCGMLCPKCLRCDQETGVCTACPLNSHLQLPNCTGCVDGRYGDTCTRVCPTANCRQCHQTTGQCEECAQNSNMQLPDCTDCHDGYHKRPDDTGCDACRGTCQSGTVCDKTTGFCLLCPPGKQGYFCEQDDKDSDSTVSKTVFAGSLAGVGLAGFIIGAGIIIVIIWIRRSRRSNQSGNATDKTEVTAATAVPADRGQTTAVFQGVTDQEGHYERVGDIPMTTKHVHPGTSTHPDTTAHVTEADNPYDRPAEQYSNTGELHIYNPLA